MFEKKIKVVKTLGKEKVKKVGFFEKIYNDSGRYIILSKKSLVLFLVFIIALCSFAFLPSVFASRPSGLMTIVVDAGHGGSDGGCEGSLEGSNEREINILYARTLKKYLENYGISVVMTRTTTDGLYSAFATNKKEDDMKRRIEIIDNSNADVVISLHMNSYSLPSTRGAQVFYNSESEVSQVLARSIQKSFVSSLPHARQTALVGDYYLLNNTTVPSVIVECGFLSNPEEELLLLSNDYREKVCYSILCGIIKYLEQ